MTTAELVLLSPKKVIKALYDYRPQGPGELAFSKGDFFHVLSGEMESDPDGWYEATNPMTGARGMVPISYFEVFNRSRPSVVDNDHPLSGLHTLQHPGNGGSTSLHTSPSSYLYQQRNSNQNLYAVTLYDFQAERPDELDIFIGENLTICAHHEFEWFIAKPINRLGGPGLVPVSYVQIIDLVSSSTPTPVELENNDIVKLIQTFKIPTVEQWKDQTAKYQASTIPLGSISSTPPALSSNTQFFRLSSVMDSGNPNGASSNRSSLSSTNTTIVEASVDSYQLDHGRYQYLIIAKLSNGKTRYLSRFYQDFYDLQVKLLELFPFEAGKIENSKRIIPSIPGPLINVNDSISKLRREKLDYYLRNLISLPANISRSEEVLALFEVLENGFDKEVVEGKRERRVLKPISQKSYYHQDRLSQYSNFHAAPGTRTSYPELINNYNSNNNINHDQINDNNNNNYNNINNNNNNNHNGNGNGNHQRSLSSSSTNLLLNTADGNSPDGTSASTSREASTSDPNANGNGSSQGLASKVKVKFYYEEDIFVLLLPTNLRLQDLKSKLAKRLLTSPSTTEDITLDELNNIQLYLKNEYDDFVEDHNLVDEESVELTETQLLQLKALEIDDDGKFHENLYDKCKIAIVV